jgi:hypothetical protein
MQYLVRVFVLAHRPRVGSFLLFCFGIVPVYRNHTALEYTGLHSAMGIVNHSLDPVESALEAYWGKGHWVFVLGAFGISLGKQIYLRIFGRKMGGRTQSV